jgi:hypothetical protein
MSVLKTTIEITKASLRVLHRNRLLMMFPLLSVMVTITLVVLLFPIIVAGSTVTTGFGLAGLYFLLHFVMTYFNAALTAESLRALRGQPASVSGGLGCAATRARSIAGLSAISSTVGFVLGAMGARPRGAMKLVKQALGIAWMLVSYLALPVMIAERRGGYDSVVRSGRLLKQTWGETAMAEVGVRIMTVQFFLVVLALAALLAEIINQPLVLAIAVFVLLGFAIVIGTLQAIYRSALYIFAAEGVIPDDFDTPDMNGVWRVK